MMFLLPVLACAVAVFVAVYRVRPEDVSGRGLRAVGLGLIGLVLLWALVSLVVEMREDRKMSAWRADRAVAIPVSDIEILDAGFEGGGARPLLQARIRNRSRSASLYFLGFRWSVSYCGPAGDCRPVGGESRTDVNGLPPGQEYVYRSGVYDIPQHPRAVGIDRWPGPGRVEAQIAVLEARGR
jgi:hypothetical protein